jgi:predicted RNA-binding Zn-ribbon protein involved in translation (DUF1610 family)
MQRIDRHSGPSRVSSHDREQFISALLKQVPMATREHALRLLRWGRTYGRLAEAECNGDWPYFHPTRAHLANDRDFRHFECPACASDLLGPAGGYCPRCRAERIIRETCASLSDTPPARDRAEGYSYPPKVVPHFQGDPRGHTVRLQIAGAPADAYDRPALAVPTS